MKPIPQFAGLPQVFNLGFSGSQPGIQHVQVFLSFLGARAPSRNPLLSGDGTVFLKGNTEWNAPGGGTA
jgi:hypothetical protein